MTVHPKIKPAPEHERKPSYVMHDDWVPDDWTLEDWQYAQHLPKATLVPIDASGKPVCDASDHDGGDWGPAP